MAIQLINPVNGKLLTNENGALKDNEGNIFYFRKGAWRFVSDSNYTDNFGFQWNKFQKTQIDRFTEGLNQSAQRFFAVTKWDKEELNNKNILEVGSGAGRFTRVVLESTEATLYSVDYSNAVEANAGNNAHERLHLFQSSIYNLPFVPHQFDKVFCFGVLQHTPDVEKSVKALINMVKPGGELVVDFYPVRGWYTKIHAKYLFRPFTTSMNSETLLSRIQSNADRLIRAYKFFYKVGLGNIVNRFLPVCDIVNTIPEGLDDETLREWVILDTFDMFSPEYDQPQRLSTVMKWFLENEMVNVEGKVLSYGKSNSVTFVRGIKN